MDYLFLCGMQKESFMGKNEMNAAGFRQNKGIKPKNE